MATQGTKEGKHRMHITPKLGRAIKIKLYRKHPGTDKKQKNEQKPLTVDGDRLFRKKCLN